MNRDFSVFSAMQVGTPYKSYIKTILGKVDVMIWNSFKNEQEGRILQGDPKSNNKDGSIIDVWNEMEDMFFRRMNKRHFERGVLLSYKRSTVLPPKSPNDRTDEELTEILISPHVKMQHSLEKFTSVVPLFRIKELAIEQERSPKLVAYIETVISKMQEKEYGIPQKEE
jgi:hypothetical protein